VFLVRPPAVARGQRGGLRIFRILDHAISISPLGTPNATPTEYKFEHITKALAVEEDPTEVRIEVMDSTKTGFGVETIRLCCEARTSLLTALLNCLDDMNGIGKCIWYLHSVSARNGDCGVCNNTKKGSVSCGPSCKVS